MSVDIFGEEILEIVEEPAYKRKKLSPFDFVKSLSQTKVNLLKQDPEHEKDLKGLSYMINKSFSYHIDTILWCNEMNQRFNIDSVMLHDFYFYGLPAKGRYSKWSKELKDDDISLIMTHYGYSKQRAIEAIEILTQDDLSDIRQSRDVGGRK